MMRVLLVDDEKELISTLAERLGLRGIKADWATSGEEALAKVDSQDYDIAVLDVKMPGIGGIELKKKIQEKSPGTKFIFMTGHGSEESYRAGSAEAGPEYYLVKPVDIDHLVQKMKQSTEEVSRVK